MIRTITIIRKKQISACALLCLLSWLTVSLAAQDAAQILEPNHPIERELAVGQEHNYHIQLQAGQSTRIAVEQRGANVLLNLFAPDGKFLLYVDRQWNTQGTEELTFVAATTGAFRLWLKMQTPPNAKNIPPGKYEVRMGEIHTATASDQLDYDAVKANSDMVMQGQQTDAESQKNTLRISEVALRLFEELKDYRALLDTRNFLKYYFQRISDKPKALENLARMTALLPRLNDPKAQAEQFINIGIAYRELYEWQRALASYEQAYRLFESIADQDGMMRTLTFMARIHTDTFNYRKVIELRTKALNFYRAQNARDFTAYLLQEIGRAYRNMGDFDKALAPLQESLQLFQELGNKEGAYDSWFSLAYLYSLTARKAEALDAYEHALPLAQELGFTNEVVQVTLEIGKIYEQFREPVKAADWLQKAAELPRSPRNSRIPEGAVLSLLGDFYIRLGNEEKGIEFHQQAVEKAADFDNYFGKGTALSVQASVYDFLRDFARLRDTRQQLFNFAQKVGDKNLEAIALIDMSYNLMEDASPLEFWQKNNAQTQKAVEYLQQARAIRQAANDPLEANPLARLSLYYAVAGDRPKALAYIEKALSLCEMLRIYDERSVRDFLSQTYAYWGEHQKALDQLLSTPLPPPHSENPVYDAYYRHRFSTHLRSVGRLVEAKEQLEKAIEIQESLRLQQKDQEIRTRLFTTVARLYEDYVGLLQQLHQQQPQQGFDRQAFLASERGRARSLLETMQTANVDIRLDADPQLLARERALQEQIKLLVTLEQSQREKKLDAATLTATRNDVDNALEQLRRLQTQIKLSSPRYSAVTQPQTPTVTDIQKQLLDADTILLAYSLGEKRSFLWAITPDSIKSYQLPARDEITAATRRVYDLLTTRQQPGKTEKDFQAADAAWQQAAGAFHQMLLGQVASQLGTKRLLIVAPEALQYLPFGALPEPVVSSRLSVVGKVTKANRQLATDYRLPLIVSHEIISLPSVSVMMLLRQELQHRQPAAKTVAVLADPVFDTNDPRVKHKMLALAKVETKNMTAVATPLARSLRSFDDRSGMARLLLSRDEAEAISAAVPVADRFKALDFQASRANAMSQALSQYRIVHFATHGLLNAEHPELSGLVFSLVDEQGKPQDGFLQLHEIYNLKLPADLVVLSACQTGLGKNIRGEGMIGLTRGFMYAGATRVVASLWRVDDYATSVLMKKFYRGMLQEKLPAAAALRKAQIEMWQQKQWQAPFYWGAFVLQGEWK